MNLRALTAITLFISFVAMSTSGLLMLVVDPSLPWHGLKWMAALRVWQSRLERF